MRRTPVVARQTHRFRQLEAAPTGPAATPGTQINMTGVTLAKMEVDL